MLNLKNDFYKSYSDIYRHNGFIISNFYLHSLFNCIYWASRPSQGTVNGGAISKWPHCRLDVKHNQSINQFWIVFRSFLLCILLSTPSILLWGKNDLTFQIDPIQITHNDIAPFFTHKICRLPLYYTCMPLKIIKSEVQLFIESPMLGW